MPMIHRGLELVLELGVARIAARLEGLTDRIAAGCLFNLIFTLLQPHFHSILTLV